MKTPILIFALSAILCVRVTAQKVSPGLIASFDKLLAEQFKPNEPGTAVLISKKGQVIYKKAFGLANLELNVPMQVNNVFRIGSITKQFTAVAILQLMEKGQLALQDEITKFIPGYPTQGYSITIEHLLTHTSGIMNFSNIRDSAMKGATDYSPKEMIDWFKGQPMRFAPGSRWEYSNSGYFLLGYIIERITGKSYGQYLEENIFKPLDMSHTFYATDNRIIPYRAAGYSRGKNQIENAQYLSLTQPYAAGAIQSTVEDLFKWQQAINANRLLSKETQDKALTRYKLNDGMATNYGYGWRMGYIQESPSFWHGGLINGFITMEIYLPKEDVFVALFSNCDCQSPEEVTANLAALAIGKPYSYTAIALDTATLAGYTGVYENGNGQPKIIRLKGNQLTWQTGRGPETTIMPYREGRFFSPEEPMITIEFSKNKNSTGEMIVHSRTANDTWTKSNKPIIAQLEIKVDQKILESYVGDYEINPNFTFTISREEDRLFLKAPGQEKVEIFAEGIARFYLKVNGAQLEFVKDNTGKITKAILTQGSRQTDARKVK